MADTTRMRALQNVASSLPVANQKVANAQQAGRDMQLQAAVRAAPVTANTTQAAQQTGAATATNAGKEMIQGAEQGVKQQGQVAQVGLQQQATQGATEVAGQQMGAQQQAADNVQRLSQIDADAKKQLYDRQMQFAKDENGRTLFNEEQLADYARARAGSDEQYKNYAQAAQNASKRQLTMMQTAYDRVQEDLTNKYAAAKQAGDEATAKQIQQQQNDIQAQMSREKARAANKAAIWQTGGTIVGAAAGSFGGPAGALAGAAVGGAVGSAIGGM